MALDAIGMKGGGLMSRSTWMKIGLGIGFFCFLFLKAFPSLAFSAGEEPEELQEIVQAPRPIRVDGRLDDWEGIRERPLTWTPEGKRLEPSPDLSVTAMFTFDAEKFYAAVKARDDRFSFPSRSWRYGDGLLLTFLEPSPAGESNRFATFGFSLEGKKPVKLLLNRDGTYFPPADVRDIELEILPDEKEGVIAYELSIPFAYLGPFRPFIRDTWGINLAYADRDMEQRKVVLLCPDRGYDTELTDMRKGSLFRFAPRIPEDVEVQMLLKASHFFDDEPIRITLAAHAPEGGPGWRVKIFLLGPGARNVPLEEELVLEKGMNIVHLRLPEKDYETGAYDVSVGLLDPRGTLKFTEDDRFFVLNRTEWGNFEAELEKLKQGDLYRKDERFRESLPNLEIRRKWMREAMEEAPPHAPIEGLEEWYEEIQQLLAEVREGRPALPPPGVIARLAHRSRIDGSLQPYTVYVPEVPDKENKQSMPKVPDKERKRVPLFVALHGSGVDETRYAASMARVLEAGRMRYRLPPMILIAPKARGLSDWYLGDSGKEVLECIEHVKKLYPVDEEKIILEGFSMGGYGAWRLSLLHPELFRAVIVRSGALVPPPFLKGENILDLLENGKNLRFFVVHGEKDNAVPVENARRAVKKMKELGIRYKYVEVKGGSHVGYDRWAAIFSWLGDIL